MPELNDLFSALNEDLTHIAGSGDPRIPVRKAQRRRAIATGGGVAAIVVLAVGGVLLAQPGAKHAAPRIVPASEAPQPSPTVEPSPETSGSPSPAAVTSHAAAPPSTITSVPEATMLSAADLLPAHPQATTGGHTGWGLELADGSTSVTSVLPLETSTGTAVAGATALRHEVWYLLPGDPGVDDIVVVLPTEQAAQTALATMLSQLAGSKDGASTPDSTGSGTFYNSWLPQADTTAGGHLAHVWKHTGTGGSGLPITMMLAQAGRTVALVYYSSQGTTPKVDLTIHDEVRTMLATLVGRAARL